MLKKILFIIVIFITFISCSSMEKNGYIKPKKLKTKNIIVTFNGFLYNYKFNKKIDMQYFITLKFPLLKDLIGKYIVVEYQDPIKKDKFTQEIIPIKKLENTMYLKSKIMYGFKNKKSYLVNISLSDNKYGNKILENISQYVRVDYMPHNYKNVR